MAPGKGREGSLVFRELARTGLMEGGPRMVGTGMRVLVLAPVSMYLFSVPARKFPGAWIALPAEGGRRDGST